MSYSSAVGDNTNGGVKRDVMFSTMGYFIVLYFELFSEPAQANAQGHLVKV